MKSYAPSLRLAAAAELELRRRRAAPLSFQDFIAQHAPGFRFYPHTAPLLGALQRVADGELSRLMCFWPPRHGKSEIVSRLFPAYLLYRAPGRWVGLASYAAELAYTLSRAAREHYRGAGGALATEGVEHWATTAGGGMWAAGVGGPATGKGFDVGIVDDPLKNAEEAASATVRAKQRDWWQSTYYTRQEPGAALVIIQTRWHEDDLSGWLLAQEGGDDEPERWHILNMPAIAEEPHAFPSTCSVEADARPPGAALCPERYPVDKLRRIEARIGSYFWAALYQQRPRPIEGALIRRDWLPIVESAPAQARRVRYWDKAASTAAGAKRTAGVRLAVADDGAVYVEHVVMGKWSTGERRSVMLATAAADVAQCGRVNIGIEQEPGSSGLDSVSDEIRLLNAFSVFADRPTGDKDTRMLPFVAQAEAGNVRLVRGAWNQAYIDELTSIPFGTYRDQGDATAGAYNRLAQRSGALHVGENPFYT
jgi:predicted phage terminase large subunit-like protein